jgi:hypothetical protein
MNAAFYSLGVLDFPNGSHRCERNSRDRAPQLAVVEASAKEGSAVATIEKTNGAVTEELGRTPSAVEPYADSEPKGVGWVAFSAIVLGFAGVWAFFEGILAISSSKVYAANATYVFSGLHTWGWILTILGALTVVAAFAVLSGSELARWFGIAIAAVNAWGQLMFLHAQPWWSVCMFAVDVLVIYGLAVYGGRKFRSG